MKKFFFAIVLLFVFFVWDAGALSLRTHLVEVHIGENGFAEVSERYELKFDSASDAEAFREAVTSNSSSLLAWEADYNFVFPHFGSVVGNIVDRSFVTFEDETNTLVVNYVLANPLASVKLEEPRQTLWEIPTKNFGAFESGGILTVPENVSVKLVLPKSAQSISVEPKASVKVEGTDVFVSGISTSFFDLKYTLLKPISGTIDIGGFFSSVPNVLLIVVVLAVLIVGYLKRKPIYQKIEDYIVSHSKIESIHSEEETELEG